MRRHGFTLIELAIVLVLVGIIMAVTFPLLMSTVQQKKVAETQEELNTIKDLVITYYRVKDSLPLPEPGYRIPAAALQIPPRFTNDPIKGVPFLYYVDPGGVADSIYVDGVSIGSMGAVIISAGLNGKFDGENATPSDGIFQSQGTGDFDDILVYVSELELVASQGGGGGSGGITCDTFTLILTNLSGGAIYVKSTPSFAVNCIRVNDGATREFYIPSGDTVSGYTLSLLCNFGIGALFSFSIDDKDEGGDCEVCVIWNGAAVSQDTCVSP